MAQNPNKNNNFLRLNKSYNYHGILFGIRNTLIIFVSVAEHLFYILSICFGINKLLSKNKSSQY